MEILKTMIFFSDAELGKIYKIDTIKYQGKMWLVPTWLDSPRTGWRIPERIICLDVLPHQKADGRVADFVLNSGIPKSVFYDPIQQPREDEYVVIENPNIQFPAIGG